MAALKVSIQICTYSTIFCVSIVADFESAPDKHGLLLAYELSPKSQEHDIQKF